MSLHSFLRLGLFSLLLSTCGLRPARPLATLPAATHTSTARPAAATRTATPVQLSLRVTDDLVNCRYGPGLLYVLLDELREGQTARVLGRNDSSTWLYVRDPGNPDGRCWIATSVSAVDGDISTLPVFEPPATSVTDMNLIVQPTIISVACWQFPQTFFFKAEVTANGPLLVNWQWEASTGISSDVRTLVFDEAGTKVINDYYQVGGPNDYWVKLHILSPNTLTQQVNFIATC